MENHSSQGWAEPDSLPKGAQEIPPEDLDSLCNEWVQKVLSSSGQEREEAARLLLEQCIRPLIKRVSERRCRSSRQNRNDFFDEAPGHVFEKLRQFDPNSGHTFQAWGYTVLYHLAIDLAKKRERRPEVLQPLGTVVEQRDGSEFFMDVPSHEAPIVDQLSWLEPISAKGLELLKRSFPPLQRVIWLAMAGFAHRVDAAVWREWLEKADVEPPFPPDEVYDFDDPLERIDCIAQALGMSRDGVRQHWYRARAVLRKNLEILKSLGVL